MTFDKLCNHSTTPLYYYVACVQQIKFSYATEICGFDQSFSTSSDKFLRSQKNPWKIKLFRAQHVTFQRIIVAILQQVEIFLKNLKIQKLLVVFASTIGFRETVHENLYITNS